MGKKINNQKLEQSELKSITIGKFENSRISSLSIFIILTLFILVIVFLPQINTKINDLFYAKNTPVNPNKPSQNPSSNPSVVEEDIIYDLTANLSIEKADLVLNNINIANGTITYSLTNPTNYVINLNKVNYYLELYNADTTLLERIKLVSENDLNAKATYSFTKNLATAEASSIAKLSLVKKNKDEYPNYALAENQNTIICTNNHENVTYSFADNQLIGFSSVFTYQNTETDYLNSILTYQATASRYNSQEGIISSFITADNNFTVTTTVDLQTAAQTYIFNADTFTKNTTPSVVHFEMSSQGFTCN